ncbi:hypothetical protein Dsin_022642 [Dipteronia sinensis]|uniref:Uncharacterized protein n=1 Tax=Dipteronia sinensis TaxID=43782 RepID=A0AAE0E1B9_9ROSI|nr:hypothetical protein Dsin_022642 [Dipteronia sinensis]
MMTSTKRLIHCPISILNTKVGSPCRNNTTLCCRAQRILYRNNIMVAILDFKIIQAILCCMMMQVLMANIFIGHGYADGCKGPLSWQEVLETCNTSSVVESQEKQLFSSGREMAEKQEHSPWPNFNGSHVKHSTMLLPQEVNSFKSPAYSSVIGTHETNSDYNAMFFDQDQIGVPLEGDLSLTVA